MAGSLFIGVEGDPPQAVLSKDAAVDEDLWAALGRNLAPGEAAEFAGRIHLPLERLLAGRTWLAETLSAHGCAADFDQHFLALLAREDSERQQVQQLIRSGAAPTVEVAEQLAASRF